MSDNNALVVRDNFQIENLAASTEIIRRRYSLLQGLMKDVMKEGIDRDYAIIPGTNKPSLLKPGAEKVSALFRLGPRYEIRETREGIHREYQVTCNIFHQTTGEFLGSGVGSCSTMESKYRYRNAPPVLTDRPVPKEYWNDRDPKHLGGPRYQAKKNDEGRWMIAEKSDGERVENMDVADQYNTVLKMAKKRAHIDAVLTVTGCSDIFTQDMEDFQPDIAPVQPSSKQQEPPVDAEIVDQKPKPEPAKEKDPLREAKKRLFAAVRNRGLNKEQSKLILKYKYAVDSTDELTANEVSQMIEIFETYADEDLKQLIADAEVI